jgi:hypothetical protein
MRYTLHLEHFHVLIFEIIKQCDTTLTVLYIYIYIFNNCHGLQITPDDYYYIRNVYDYLHISSSSLPWIIMSKLWVYNEHLFYSFHATALHWERMSERIIMLTRAQLQMQSFKQTQTRHLYNSATLFLLLPVRTNRSRRLKRALWVDQSLIHIQPTTMAVHWCMSLAD